MSWHSIVEEFINARAAARAGDLDPLKTFINETLGEPWEDQLGEIDDFDFLETRRGDCELMIIVAAVIITKTLQVKLKPQ